MKTPILTALLFACWFIAISDSRAQRGEGQERLRAFQSAFFAERLGLTEEQTKAFLPIFEDFHQKRRALRRQQRESMSGDLSILTDEQIKTLLQKRLSLREEELRLEREYLEKLQSVLPLRKIAELPRVERSFREELLGRIRQHHPRPGGGQ